MVGELHIELLVYKRVVYIRVYIYIYTCACVYVKMIIECALLLSFWGDYHEGHV